MREEQETGIVALRTHEIDGARWCVVYYARDSSLENATELMRIRLSFCGFEPEDEEALKRFIGERMARVTVAAGVGESRLTSMRAANLG